MDAKPHKNFQNMNIAKFTTVLFCDMYDLQRVGDTVNTGHYWTSMVTSSGGLPSSLLIFCMWDKMSSVTNKLLLVKCVKSYSGNFASLIEV